MIRERRRRLLLISLTFFVLLASGFALGACSSAFQDEEYDKLGDALGARWNPDDSIPSVSMGFETRATSGSPKETWLAIELSYTKNCSETADDPCEVLVDELARIVLEQYTRIEDLNGLQIIVTNDDAFGPVDAGSPNAHLGPVPLSGSTFDRSVDHLVKSLTIEEWREDLSIEEGE